MSIELRFVERRACSCWKRENCGCSECGKIVKILQSRFKELLQWGEFYFSEWEDVPLVTLDEIKPHRDKMMDESCYTITTDDLIPK